MTSIFATDVEKCFEELGIAANDDVLVHADSIVTAAYDGPTTQKLDILYNALFEKISPSGHLFAPSFSMSFTKGEDYDLETSPSTTGMASEHFRLMPNVRRSLDPLYNFCIRGPSSEMYASIRSESCFGNGSLFNLFYDRNVKMIFLGCSLDRATFVHFVEETIGVDYRYYKNFNGLISTPHEKYASSINLYVRNLDLDTIPNHDSLKLRLEEASLLKASSIGRFRCMCVSAQDFFVTAADLLQNDKYALIRQEL